MSDNKNPTAVYLMVFFSGFAGLAYQILWMRQLGFLFGSTSHAAAVTLAAFFAGLAAGSWFWGRRSTAMPNALRVYAWLEAGIALTALLYFGIRAIFGLVFPAVYQSVGDGALLLAIKFVLALLLICPPAFFMGGTIPVIGQFAITKKGQFGTTAARLYGINTMGAAVGAFTAGFFLVGLLGFTLTCILAMVVTISIAAAAYRLSGGLSPAPGDDKPKKKPKRERKADGHITRAAIHAICFLSGFGILSLEVVWTRMLAQVHENSTYSFTTVLVTVLICLGLGAMIASRLARSELPPVPALAVLLIVGGLTVGISPFVFTSVTGGLRMLATGNSLTWYLMKLFLHGFVTIGVPALALATVFPFLMKIEERFAPQPGEGLGRLSAVNTVGAILGSLLCGFVLLRLIGMWRTTQLVAAIYVIAAVALPVGKHAIGPFIRIGGGVFLLLLFTGLSPAALPVTGPRTNRTGERVLEVWETSDCTVAVVEDVKGGRTITINSNYSLGSSMAVPNQIFQGRLPLLAYPETESVFFLGMGTGITAGAALGPEFESMKRVVACELVPEVVEAARKHMTGSGPGAPDDLTNGLFSDERAEVLVADGRHYLMASKDSFDVINADLFLPYRRGAGSLYSLEHFSTAKQRLKPGGVYVQWLPLYQITQKEFGTIAKTMLTAFEQVTLWRHNFQPGAEVAALVGQREDSPVPASASDATQAMRAAVAGRTWRDINNLMLPLDEQTITLFYCGNLTAAKDLFADYPINSDDMPIVEYSAPGSLRGKTGDLPPTFIGPRFAALVDEVLKRCPPSTDPMLANRSAANRRLPLAGSALHHAWVAMALGDEKTWREAWTWFVDEWTGRGSKR